MTVEEVEETPTEVEEVEVDETPNAEVDDEQRATDAADLITKLRDENAKRRVAAKAAEKAKIEAQKAHEAAEERSRRLAKALHASDYLRDPDTLPYSDSFWDDDAQDYDGSAIREAAEQLALTRPDLARPRGDVGAGYRGEDTPNVDLANMLRQGA